MPAARASICDRCSSAVKSRHRYMRKELDVHIPILCIISRSTPITYRLVAPPALSACVPISSPLTPLASGAISSAVPDHPRNFGPSNRPDLFPLSVPIICSRVRTGNIDPSVSSSGRATSCPDWPVLAFRVISVILFPLAPVRFECPDWSRSEHRVSLEWERGQLQIRQKVWEIPLPP